MTQQHHYFASSALGWATGDTREEAVRKCIRHSGTSTVKKITAGLHKQGKEGFYVWSCRVDVPSDTNYRIEWYSPQGVPKSEGYNHAVTHITAKELAYTSTPQAKD